MANNLFKSVAHAAGSVRRPRKSEHEKFNEAAVKNAAVNLMSLRDGKRLVSEKNETFRTLNAGTTAETAYQLLKRGVAADVILAAAASGELKPLPGRFDWSDIFAKVASAEGGKSIFAQCVEDEIDPSELATVFGLTVPEGLSTAPTTEEAPKATVKKREPKVKPAPKAKQTKAA